jgi:hypothetical protein
MSAWLILLSSSSWTKNWILATYDYGLFVTFGCTRYFSSPWPHILLSKPKVREIITLTWNVKCLKALIFWGFSCLLRRREIEFAVSASQAQFPVFKSFQFTIQISFQDGGHSMSDYFSLKYFLHLSTNLPRFSMDFVFILLCTFLEVDLVFSFVQRL